MQLINLSFFSFIHFMSLVSFLFLFLSFPFIGRLLNPLLRLVDQWKDKEKEKSNTREVNRQLMKLDSRKGQRDVQHISYFILDITFPLSRVLVFLFSPSFLSFGFIIAGEVVF